MARGVPPAWLVAALVSAFIGCSSQTPPSAAVRPASVAAASQEPFKGLLARWNWYRESVGLPPITADPGLSEGAAQHSKYLIQNHVAGADAFIENGRMSDVQIYPGVRTEAAGNPGYSLASERAANAGYIVRTAAVPADGASIIDMMMPLGFNEVPLLNPQLAAIGYGSYCENDCVITIALRQGASPAQLASLYEVPLFIRAMQSPVGPFLHARLKHPILFPPAGGTSVTASFDGKAQPDPQTSCGYAGDSGPPILLSLGAPREGVEVKLSSYSFKENGVLLESCAFDESTYKNPNGYLQKMAREYLDWGGAVMLIPRKPLEPGHTYTVSITADNQTYAWSFTVAPDAK